MKDEVEKLLKVAKSRIKLSYPDEYPQGHDKLHIAGVTLEGMDDYESFLIDQLLELFQTAQVEAVRAALQANIIDVQMCLSINRTDEQQIGLIVGQPSRSKRI